MDQRLAIMLTTRIGFKTMKRALLTIALALTLNPAQANTGAIDSISVLSGGWSQHWNDPQRDRYNEDNEVLGLVFNNKYVIAKMKNSYWHDSYLIAYNYTLASYDKESFSVSASLMGGVVSGYKENEISLGYLGNDLSLYFVPNIQVKYNLTNDISLGVDLGFIGHRYGIATTQTINVTYKF